MAAVDLEPAAAPSQGVVLLHGIGRTHRWMRKLERALQRAGFATLNLDYASRKKPLELLAADIHEAVARFADGIDGPVHFVGHSMGGLLARIYLAKSRPRNLGRVVMLGTPNGGSEVADLLHQLAIYRAYYGPAGQQLTTRLHATLTSLPAPDYAAGIIAGNRSLHPLSSLIMLPRPNDGMVSVASTGLTGMADHVIVDAYHAELPRHRAAIGQTIAFLQEGRFSTDLNATATLVGPCTYKPKPGRAAYPSQCPLLPLERPGSRAARNDAMGHNRTPALQEN